jgi:hypothetical protein
MNKRKITNSTLYSKRISKPIKISKLQEDAYWEIKKREREEKFANDFYQENKYRLIPAIVITTIIAYPFIKIYDVYKYCKNKNWCKINPE